MLQGVGAPGKGQEVWDLEDVFACHFGAATTHKDATWRGVCLRVRVCGWFCGAADSPVPRFSDSSGPPPALRLRAFFLP